MASDMTQSRKPQTTVAMDYGLITLDGDERIHLYGTPGQERFDFMWNILIKGGIGLILLLDNTRKDPFQDMKFYTHAFREFIEQQQLVVGITRMDLQRRPGLTEYRQWLEQLGLKAPIFEVDARSRNDVITLVQALLYSLDPGFLSMSEYVLSDNLYLGVTPGGVYYTVQDNHEEPGRLFCIAYYRKVKHLYLTPT